MRAPTTTRAISPIISRPVLLTGLLIAAVAGLSLSGCAGVQRVGGSTLSEATKEVKKGPGEKKKALVAGTPIDEGLEVVEIVVEACINSDDEYEEGCEEERPGSEEDMPDGGERGDEGAAWKQGFVGFSYGGTRYRGSALADSRSFILRFGLTEPQSAGRLHAGMELAFTPVRFDRVRAESLDGGLELAVGGDVRYDLTPAHTFAGIQLIGGFRAGVLRWDYANPVLIEDEYGDLAAWDSDHIYTWTPYGGLGLAFMRIGGLRLGTELIAGMTFFNGHTSSGLANDLFAPTPQVQLRFQLSQHF